MKSNEKLKLFGIPFVAALVIYFGGYYAVEHQRHRKGPWRVDFMVTNGFPAIVVQQPHLGLSNIVVVIENETPVAGFTNATVAMTEPRNLPYPVPHGRVIYEDLTFLPGTVTFDLSGHGIELLPRTLILNGREHAWRSGETITLKPEEKIHPITPEEYKARVKALKKAGEGR